MPKVSATVIAMNEEKQIAQCLESLAWCDEIVVVDAGSTDRTVEIARRFTDRIIVNEWPGYSAQKNFATDNASNDWVLSVDADEVVSPELAREIQELLRREPAHAGYKMPRRQLYHGQWIRRAGYSPHLVLRLFRKDRGRFVDRLVHEKVKVQGTVGRLKGWILHDNIQNLEEWVLKNVRYCSLAALQDARAGKRVRPWSFLDPCALFFMKFILKRGFLDGRRGLVFSLLPAVYRCLVYCFLWEMQESDERRDRER